MTSSFECECLGKSHPCNGDDEQWRMLNSARRTLMQWSPDKYAYKNLVVVNKTCKEVRHYWDVMAQTRNLRLLFYTKVKVEK